MKRALCRRHLACSVAFVLLAALAPQLASADAPGVRGPEVAPAGNVASPGWQGVEPLPPITGVPAPATGRATFSAQATAWNVPPATLYGQPAQQPVEAAGFSLRELNPGNWVLDAGMGIVSAMMQSVQQTLLGFISAVSGTQASAADTTIALGCDNGALGLLFCTKPDQLLPPYDLIGPQMGVVGGPLPLALHTVWLALQPAAFVLLTIVFTVRLGRVMYAGPATFQAEVKSLLLPFLASCALVAATPMLLRQLLTFFAALNRAVLIGGVLGSGNIAIPYLTYVPIDFVATMAIGPSAALLALFVVLFVVVVVAIIRLAKLTVLFAIAPLAGATLIDRSTAPLFGNWISRVLELLLHQLGWSLAALVGSSILGTLVPSLTGEPTDAASFILQIIGTTLVLLFMLCQQQLFSGVLWLAAGGTSPVMGGAMEKVATFVNVRDGIWRKPEDATVKLPAKTQLFKTLRSQPAPVAQQPAGFTGWYGGAAKPSVGHGQPGARARASTQRSNGLPSQPTAAPPRPAAPPPAGLGVTTVVSNGYIAAGRVRRKPAGTTPAATTAAGAPNPERTVLLRRLQAQSAQSGHQAWRAAPAALAHRARWTTVRAGSAAQQLALRKLGQRSAGNVH